MFLKKAIQKETRFSHIVPIAIGINASETPFLSSIILWFYVLKIIASNGLILVNLVYVFSKKLLI
jgi:hypothetical protein